MNCLHTWTQQYKSSKWSIRIWPLPWNDLTLKVKLLNFELWLLHYMYFNIMIRFDSHFSLNIICFSLIVKKACSLNHSRVYFLEPTSTGIVWRNMLQWPWWGLNPRSLGREADTLTTRPLRPLTIFLTNQQVA